MIIEFGAKNFHSFKEGVEISFELGKAGEKNISSAGGVSNLLCLKGKNGAGKTNVLQILWFLQSINTRAFEKKPDEPVGYETYFYNDAPAEAYIIFNINNVKYEYTVSFKTQKIIHESLKIVKGTKILFERKDNKIVKVHKDFEELKRIKLRSNVGTINMAYQYELDNIRNIHDFFAYKIICNAHSLNLLDDSNTVENITSIYNSDHDMFEFCKKILKKSDLGIEDITIEEKTIPEDKKEYLPFFHYKTPEGLMKLPFHDQAAGTKKLYKSLLLYFWTLRNGGTAVIDELDLHLHPHLIPELFKLFEDKSINTKNAQLIFTSHLTEIMDTMGKYRTYIIEKEDNESFAYRLDEIDNPPIRNDRPISPLYNRGLLGGVPKL